MAEFLACLIFTFFRNQGVKTQTCIHIRMYLFLGFIRSFAQFAVLDQNTSNVYP